ncbi:centromere protein J [Cydia pomonella]|uniref:centromere protein J n=1 Tax=Cydia pomonella TaxID=82600 RepID=UPI002ADE02FA|nr:centromere protein J [Cydia pomonella]
MGFLLLVFSCCIKCAIKTTLAMNQSYSESDVSLSPTQILERLHLLRQLQLLQQDKLLKQRQLYQESPRNSSITEIVSQFSASTSFNTFRSLLGSSESSTDATPRLHSSKSQLNQQDLVEGVAVLNLSQESEFIITSPVSSRSKASNASQAPTKSGTRAGAQSIAAKKQISLDDMPVLTPKKDFEALIIEKLKNELDAPKPKIIEKENLPSKSKKPFLKKGEGMSRFGLHKNKPVIQSTYALPWKQASNAKNVPVKAKASENSKRKNVDVQIVVSKPKPEPKKKPAVNDKVLQPEEVCNKQPNIKVTQDSKQGNSKQSTTAVDSSNCELHGPKPLSPPKQREIIIQLPKGKHPLLSNKGKTWAAVLTKEQDDLLRQLKQSDYYKNFTSPAKSILSDISCDETLMKLRQEREMAEQNMFELLENKVDHESFNLNNSFMNRFLQGSNLECSGESTPVIMQRCLASNPKLMTLCPDVHQTRNVNSQSDIDCNSEYTEYCSEACSSACSCSCNNTIEESNNLHDISKSNKKQIVQHNKTNKTTKEVDKQAEVKQCHNDKEIDSMKENMAEMNAKLVATSELLKDRLRELEDEIETFRKENANLTKMREDIDMEKQKFYEEKSTFEQKFNEEKILSEYYLAEEKEKLTKQKQIYERQVREMRGRLNKKDKDEVATLKKEINDLKEEMRLKDAKYTTVAARLRNQLKMIEREKKDLQEEVEKLKKENRRIQHSNDITRRMTKIKYLEQINKKLCNAKSAQRQVVPDDDIKYKTFEIERKSRSRVQPAAKNPLRARAKSVPNLNVTSRYAKYFSQRDVVSPTERNQTLNIERYHSDYVDDGRYDHESESLEDAESASGRDATDNEDDNSLEKIYMQRFQEHSKDVEPVDKQRSICSSSNHSFEKTNLNQKTDDFFIHRSNSASIRESKSPKQISPCNHPSGSSSNRSKSPVSILSHRSTGKSPVTVINHEPDYLPSTSRSNHSHGRSTSPISSVSNHTYSCSSQRIPTVINREYLDNRSFPAPPLSKSSITKTELTPTEIRKSDGSKELRFPNGNVKYLSADGKYSKFVYYNGDVKENFYNEGRIKYYYAETKTLHTTHPDGLEVLEFPDGQVEKRYKDGSSEIRLPNGTVRYFDPKNPHVREEWRFPDGATLTASASGERRVLFPNGQVEVHTKDHKRREFPDGTVKLVYNDGTAETRYASGRVRIKDKHGNLIMDSVPS